MVNWDDNPCFICGMHTEVGLRAHFEYEEEGGHVHSALAVGETWQGFKGVVHGGIIAGLIDDAMWHALFHDHQLITMTAQLTVRYRRPVPINTPLDIFGAVTQFNRRAAHAKAWIASADGILVTAEGIFMPPKDLKDD